MSVMLICKKEYIKAAGLLAGVKAITGNNDIKPDDLELYFDFSDCYTLNFNSFYRRYAVNHKEVAEMKPDNLSYYDLFMEYKSVGVELAKNGKISPLVSELYLFKESSMYQIEEYPEFEEKAEKIYSRIFDSLKKYFRKHDDLVSWGHIDIDYIREVKSA